MSNYNKFQAFIKNNKFFVFISLAYVLFHKVLEAFINKLIVSPILSTVNGKHPVNSA